MRSAFDALVDAASLILYSLVVGFCFILLVELMGWSLSYLMGTTLLSLLHRNKEWEALAFIFGNYRILLTIFGTGLVVYTYYRLTEKP
ncbi:MAG: hypothetical protein WC529_08340 [Candidatus Margulisiibacteriota bacterium]